MKNMDDDFEAGDTWYGYEGRFQKEKKATYVWLSKDKLKSYTVTFKRFDWLSTIANKINDRVWTPVSVERGACKPK